MMNSRQHTVAQAATMDIPLKGPMRKTITRPRRNGGAVIIGAFSLLLIVALGLFLWNPQTIAAVARAFGSF